MYYRLEITSVDDAVACPNCARPVLVVRAPARLHGECGCGAKLEFVQRRPVQIPKRTLVLPPADDELNTSERF
jgi:hypothetical protein